MASPGKNSMNWSNGFAEIITQMIPTLYKYRKGRCFLIPKSQDSCFLVEESSVFFLKKRCLSCFHFRIKNGCGIGCDTKSICIIPHEKSKGWSNVLKGNSSLKKNVLLVISKIMTLIEDKLPDFVEEQIPIDFFDQKCYKFIQLKPIMHRMLIDLDKQVIEIENRGLPLVQKMKYLREVEYEKKELMERLALVI